MEVVTAEELSKRLHIHNSEDKFTRCVINLAKNSNLIIVSAIGNDTIVFNGALTEEFDLFKGGKIFIDKDGLAYTKQCANNLRKPIEAFWEEYRMFVWKFLTIIPHSKYCLKKDGKNFCQGIIFNLKDI